MNQRTILANASSIVISVETGDVLREGANRFVGINLNYIRDLDANRAAPQARPLNAALKEMGVRWLRYPGGEKSDCYVWAEPAYTKPKPQSLMWYKTVAGVRMDFDRYIATCRAVGAEPYVVAAFDTVAVTGRTEAQWLEHAVSLVRYANVTKKYGVRYWEVGNENWQSVKPDEMARIVGVFSRAMRAIDPTIRIGASGQNLDWWKAFLPTAAPHLDFLSLSAYVAWEWKSYERFAQTPAPNLLNQAGIALSAIDSFAPAPDRARLKVVVAETNSKDYSKGGWGDENSLGHALVTFDTLGQMMAQPRIESAMVWTTRWVNDTEAPRNLFYALDARNVLLPTGQALALWGRFVQEKMVRVTTGGSTMLNTYATCSDDQRSATVCIVNRGLAPVTNVRVAVNSPVPYTNAAVYRFSGSGPNDLSPTLRKLPSKSVLKNTVVIASCPAVSVTVLTLRVGGVRGGRR